MIEQLQRSNSLPEDSRVLVSSSFKTISIPLKYVDQCNVIEEKPTKCQIHM